MIEVNVSEFKQKLGKFMKAIREGKEIFIKDRDHRFAKLSPVSSSPKIRSKVIFLPKNPAAPPLGEVKVKGISYSQTNSTALLIEDRRRR